MNITSKFSWLPELALRTLGVLCIAFILMNAWSLYSAYVDVRSSPLVPASIAAYSAFPYYFFIAFYLGIIFLVWKLLKGDPISKYWWVPVALVFLFKFFKMFIYGFLMWINIFG